MHDLSLNSLSVLIGVITFPHFIFEMNTFGNDETELIASIILSFKLVEIQLFYFLQISVFILSSSDIESPFKQTIVFSLFKDLHCWPSATIWSIIVLGHLHQCWTKSDRIFFHISKNKHFLKFDRISLVVSFKISSL